MANEPLTPEREQEIRAHNSRDIRIFETFASLKLLQTEAALQAFEDRDDLLAEIDRLRCERDDWRRNAEHSAAVGIEMRTEISRLREELAIVEQENKEVRQGAERECDRLREQLVDVQTNERK